MRPLRSLLVVVSTWMLGAGLLGGCGVPVNVSESQLTGGVVMVPTADVSTSRVVGVPNATALYTNVDDGSSFTASDGNATYVRAQAGVGQGRHRVSFGGGPSGTVTQVMVAYTATVGTATSGTAQALLFDGSTLIGTGKVNSLGAWGSFSESFGNLSVASAANLRCEMVLTNQSGSGAVRYSELWLSVLGGTAPPPPDAGVPPPPPDAGSPPPPPPPPGTVDATTLTGKLMMGYQGWFFCPGDGSPVNRWVHWFRGGNTAAPTIDLWPDVTELPSAEQCPTPYTFPGGRSAPVYSAYRAATVARHFEWMAQNHLDGVMLQRFSSELADPAFFAARNKVTQNVMAGAQTYGRTFTIMYDVSGQDPTTLVSTLENDWKFLVDTLGVTRSGRYTQHRGKPVLAIWGFGFADRSVSPAQGQQLVDFFKNNPDPKYRVTLMLGVPRAWRTLSNWTSVFNAADVISPWTVGSYSNDSGADAYQATLKGDLADTSARGIDYMPVVFPGFSWHNLNGGPINQIPRLGGTFYWRQVYDALSSGSKMLYGAMFDEVDEGTAMFKVGATANDVPTQAPFVPLDIDGDTLPSDWYLRLADKAGAMLRREIPLSPTIPIKP